MCSRCTESKKEAWSLEKANSVQACDVGMYNGEGGGGCLVKNVVYSVVSLAHYVVNCTLVRHGVQCMKGSKNTSMMQSQG